MRSSWPCTIPMAATTSSAQAATASTRRTLNGSEASPPARPRTNFDRGKRPTTCRDTLTEMVVLTSDRHVRILTSPCNPVGLLLPVWLLRPTTFALRWISRARIPATIARETWLTRYRALSAHRTAHAPQTPCQTRWTRPSVMDASLALETSFPDPV